MNLKKQAASLCIVVLMATVLWAGEADVIGVEVTRTGSAVYRFSVSVLHQDQGWDHYADRWEVLAPDGRVLATRTLYHPHVNEQPFTRHLEGVEIPRGTGQVEIRAHCSVHGTGGKSKIIRLPQ